MNRFLYPLFLISIFLLPKSNYAQNRWEPGYIVTAQLDTLKGLIEYKNWKINPDQISFKTEESEQPTTYSQDDLAGFVVHNEKYLKATVSVNISSDKINELSEKPTPDLVSRTVMLLVLFEGKKNLFLLHDHQDKSSFYINENGEYTLLVDHTYRRYSSNDRSYIIHSDQYKQQLQNYLPGCAAAASKIKSTSYSEKSISQVYESYFSQCTNEKPSVKFVKEKKLFEYGVLAGAIFTKVNFKGSDAPDYLSGRIPASVNFSGGIFANFILARTQRRFSVYADLLYTNYSVENSQTSKISFNDNFVQTSTSKIGFSYLKLSTMARYKFPISTITGFIQGGITNALAISETNSYTRVRTLNGIPSSTSEGEALSDVRKYEQGFVFGVGTGFQRFGIELRYENSNGMAVYKNLNSNVQRGYLLVSYQL